MIRIFLISGFFLSASFSCENWSEPTKIGDLKEPINESSGLKISSDYPTRAYHINDSGDGPSFYQTNLEGGNLRKIRINNFFPRDTEGLGYENCPVIGRCLIIGDIGDNNLERDNISFIFVKEQKNFPLSVDPVLILEIRYPYGPKNSEAFAFTPEGDLVLISKEPRPKIYMIPSELIVKSLKRGRFHKGLKIRTELIYVSDLNIPYLDKSSEKRKKLITDMDISPDGTEVILMTYEDAIYFKWKEFRKFFNNGGLKKLIRMMPPAYSIIELERLEQQEAVSFGNIRNRDNTSWFIYTSEFSNQLETQQKSHSSPIMKIDCLDN